MKLRKSYVCNSSSSSFICSVCQEVESGWDLSLSDVNMSECENGHTCHTDEFIKFDEDSIEFKEELIKKQIKNYERQILLYEEKLKDIKNEKSFDNFQYWIDTNKARIVKLNSFDSLEMVSADEIDDEWRYSILAKYCPICSFTHIINEDIVMYFLKKNNLTRDDIKKEIKTRFKTYDEFTEYLNDKKEK